MHHEKINEESQLLNNCLMKTGAHLQWLVAVGITKINDQMEVGSNGELAISVYYLEKTPMINKYMDDTLDLANELGIQSPIVFRPMKNRPSISI